MKRYIPNLICVLATLLISCSPTIHEGTDGSGTNAGNIEMDLRFSFDDQMPAYTRQMPAEMIDYKVRFIIEVYSLNSDGTIPENPIKRYVVNQYQMMHDGLSDTYVKVQLSSRRYKIMGWIDYVRTADGGDFNYITTNLRTLTLNVSETGAYEDVYAANFDLDLSQYVDQRNVNLTRVVELKRPVAKLRFVTTDIDKYVQKAARLASTITENIAVRVDYTSNFPNVYDLLEERPTGSRQNVSFTSSITNMTMTEAEIGSDFIFASDAISYVRADLTFTDKTTSTVINRVSISNNIPLKRGHVTTVRDEFLTRTTNPGVIIDTDWDGEINVTLPD